MEIEIVTLLVEGTCEVDRPSRSTGVNPNKKQMCCSPSCLLSQVQWDTYEQVYYQSMDN